MNKFVLILLTISLNFLALNAKDINKKNGDMPAIVSIEWLKKNQSNNNLVILDIREYKEYKKGHIKGAVNIPGLENLFAADSWMMPKLDKLKTLFSNAGIDKDSLVVAYDNGDFF
jgi:thiosulfate/3-mercaptopyruvate sulfurtransferase